MFPKAIELLSNDLQRLRELLALTESTMGRAHPNVKQIRERIAEVSSERHSLEQISMQVAA